MIETIPIDNEDAQRTEPFAVEIADLTAWPDQRLRVNFEFNSYMERFVFNVEHVGFGELIPKSVATVDYQYSAWPYILFSFITPNDDYAQVTASNLGAGVELGVFPGPEGGDFLPGANITASERAEIFGLAEEA